MRLCWITLGLAVLFCAAASAFDADGEGVEFAYTLLGIDGQGHENTSARKVRQLGFGFPPPPPPPGFGFGAPGFGPGFGGPGFGGPGFGGPAFGGPGFGGPGFGRPGFGGPGFGGNRQRVRVTERVRTRTTTVNNGFGGGFYG